MNGTLRRTWPSLLVAVLALLYVWIGIAAHGRDRILGLGGGLVILAAIVAARRAMPGAYALLVIGALPLAILTWWSIATPVLAIVTLPLGWIAVRHLRRPRQAVDDLSFTVAAGQVAGFLGPNGGGSPPPSG